MKTKKSLLSKAYIILAIMAMLCTCTVDNRVIPEGQAIGFVEITDIHGRASTDLNGVTVEATGTGIQTITTSNGRFELSKLPVGTVDLHFSKEGLGKREVENILIGGGNLPAFIRERIHLFELPLVENVDAKVSLNQEKIIVDVQFTAKSPFSCILWISESSDFLNPVEINVLKNMECCRQGETIHFEKNIELNHGNKDRTVYIRLFFHNPFESLQINSLGNRIFYSSKTIVFEKPLNWE